MIKQGKVGGPSVIRAMFSILLGLFGIALLYGGVLLAFAGGSMFYLLQGTGILTISLMLWRRHPRARFFYAISLFVTIVWALWEAGFDGWAVLPRLWMSILLGLGFLLPAVSASTAAGAKTSGGQSWLLFAGGVVVSILLGGMAHLAGPADPSDPLFQAGTQVAVPVAVQRGPEAPGEDWMNFGNDAGGSRFSTLGQITPSNVSKLRAVWKVNVGKSADGQYASLEATPLKVGNSLYVCTGFNDVLSIDAETGNINWRFKSGIRIKSLPFSACRGVAYYRVPNPTGSCGERILTNTLDARLIALDAQTGKPCAGFGDNGTTNLLKGMNIADPGYYMVTSAPTVVHGKVVLGGWISDNQYWGEPSGVIRAFDAVTGKLAWAFDAGRPGERGVPGPGETYTPATPNSWAPMSADEKLGLVYAPTGNATPDYFGVQRRPFDEKYSSSVVALDGETGEVRWSFQTVHHDLWDYDVASQPTLVDLRIGAQAVPALVQPTKRGELFVLDRRTGQPLYPVTEHPAPQRGAIPEERLAPTQPFSDAMPSFRGPNLRERDMWGLTPFDQIACRIAFRKARYDGTMTPPGLTPNISYPGFLGGMDWGSVAVNRDSGLMIVTSSRVANYNRLIPRLDADKMGIAPIQAGKVGDVGGPAAQGGTPYAVSLNVFLSPLGTPCNEPPYGLITAVDLNTRKVVWSKPLGTARDSGPLGVKSRLPISMGMLISGGSLLTRSGLIFVAAAQELTFRAIDQRTGTELWKTRLPSGGHSVPMTYWSNRSKRQFVVLAAGGNIPLRTEVGDTIIGYALPRSESDHSGSYPAEVK